MMPLAIMPNLKCGGKKLSGFVIVFLKRVDIGLVIVQKGLLDDI
jgi:hypothetical protein